MNSIHLSVDPALIYTNSYLSTGFPGGIVERIHLPMREAQETWVRSLGQEDPLEKGMVTHSSIRAGKNSMDRAA